MHYGVFPIASAKGDGTYFEFWPPVEWTQPPRRTAEERAAERRRAAEDITQEIAEGRAKGTQDADGKWIIERPTTNGEQD